MPLEISARATIKTDAAGRYELEIGGSKHYWQGELSRFEPGTAVVVTVKRWYKKRSLRQNSLLHAYIGILADELGYGPDTMKELIRLKWLKQPIYDKDGNELVDMTTGEVLFELRSTTELSTVEMVELCDSIRVWALEGFNVTLPLPGDEMEFNFNK